MEARVQQLETALEEKEVKLLQAAVIGRRLLEENDKLRRASAAAHAAPAGPQPAETAKAEELHAKVRALQDQLRDAERVNSSLLEEIAAKEKEAQRLGAGRGEQLSRRSEGRDGKGGRAGETACDDAGVGDDGREAGVVARRAELAEKKRLEHIHDLEERNVALTEEAATRKTEWEARVKHENERAVVLQRQLAVMQDEWEHATATARQREGEAMEAKRELAHLQRMVKQISEEKEIAEERVLERKYSGGAAGAAGSGSSVEEETQRLREMEDARRALIQIRNRTLEAEAMRDQVRLVVKENERLRFDLDETRKKLDAEVRRRTEAEIEMEIWKERGVKLQAQLK
jgi:hypothetical protein